MKSMDKNIMKAAWRAMAAGLLTLAASATAWAQNVVQAVSASQQAGAEVVRIELAQPLSALPAGFTVQTPPRVAIDLPGVTNGTGRPSIEINQGNLRSVSLAQAGDRTRVVLNLKQAANYSAQLQGNALLVVLDPVQVSEPGSARPASQFAENLNTDMLPLRNIDFRRGTDGAGRVVVELPNNQVGVDIRQQGAGLLVEFQRSSLPESLRRRLDVTDFGTPVQTITTTQDGDRVRMLVEPRGLWEHSAYQSDNQFVLEVRAQKIDPNKLVQGPGYQGEKLSLNFQSIEVRALLQVIADFTNFNVVTSDTVTGSVTLRLKDVPWDQALDIILQAKGLGMRKVGNVLWIAPQEEIVKREKDDLEAKAKVAQLEPLRMQLFQMNYARAEEVAKVLTGMSRQAQVVGRLGALLGTTADPDQNATVLSSRGTVTAEPRTNQLFVTDTPSRLEEIQRIISQIDVPVRQVMIEARIVEASDSFGRELGVKLGATDLRGLRGGVPGWGNGSTRIGVTGTYLGVGEQTGQAAVTDGSYIPNSYFLNMPAAALGGVSPASIALSLFGASSNRFLNLELSALEADGKGKIISSPRVITSDQREALIEQGTEIPYQEASASGATSVSFKKAVMALRVTPQITPEGNVIMNVQVSKDRVGEVVANVPSIDTKKIHTQVLVENGGTVVIGGIFEQEESENTTKVPLLGDLPAVGNLFKSRSRSTQKTELLVFLTPRVISERATVR
jgi:type IV pilus assembly protein PilQ